VSVTPLTNFWFSMRSVSYLKESWLLSVPRTCPLLVQGNGALCGNAIAYMVEVEGRGFESR
jgi:hypothetical protein